MSVSIEALGIHRLNVSDRLELIEQIWASLAEQISSEEMPKWHRTELAKRRAQAETSPGCGKPWREAIDAIDRA